MSCFPRHLGCINYKLVVCCDMNFPLSPLTHQLVVRLLIVVIDCSYMKSLMLYYPRCTITISTCSIHCNLQTETNNLHSSALDCFEELEFDQVKTSELYIGLCFQPYISSVLACLQPHTKLVWHILRVAGLGRVSCYSCS